MGARERVLQAARELMAEGGVAAVTIEELSARTGVARPTIYRSWPNAKAVAMAALMQAAPVAPATADGSPSARLKRLLADTIAAFATTSGRNAAALIASADPSTELAKAFRHSVLLETRQQVVRLLEQAVASGGVRADLDAEAVADMVLAPVFFRLLVGHAPLAEDLAEGIVDALFAGIGP